MDAALPNSGNATPAARRSANDYAPLISRIEVDILPIFVPIPHKSMFAGVGKHFGLDLLIQPKHKFIHPLGTLLVHVCPYGNGSRRGGGGRGHNDFALFIVLQHSRTIRAALMRPNRRFTSRTYRSRIGLVRVGSLSRNLLIFTNTFGITHRPGQRLTAPAPAEIPPLRIPPQFPQ